MFRLITLSIALTLLLGPASLPAQSGQEGHANAYRLSEGDKLRITVYGHEDLSGEFDIDATGHVSLPLIGDVSATGLTANGLEEAIAAELQPDYLKNPRVSAELLDYRPFYIVGEVNTPGSYTYTSGMTVISAVAMAGGYTYRAKKNRIHIVRGSGTEQEKINATDNTPIFPGDVIEIPERFF